MFWQPLIKIVESRQELDVMLSLMVEELCKLSEVNACSIFTLEEHEHIYTLGASTLAPSIKHGMIYLDANEDLIGKVALREEPIAIDYTSQSNVYSMLYTLSRKRFHSLFATPIVYKSEVIAILVLQHVDKQAISESIKTDIITFCANVSLPLNRALHADDILEQIEETPSNALYFNGVSANDGVTRGNAFARYNITDIDNIPDKGTQVEDEETLFINAVNEVKANITEMLRRVTKMAGEDEGALFDAYLQIIDSRRFYDAIINLIREGIWVQSAVKQVTLEQASIFEKMDDPYLTERASDIKDLGKRILLALENKSIKKSLYPQKTILVANEVTASMIAEVPKGKLKAVITEHGSAYSHAAIIAKALSIPFITNINALPVSFIDGKEVIVDAYRSRIYVNPTKGVVQAYDRIIAAESQKTSELQLIKNLPSKTTDDHLLILNANVGLIADLDLAISQGANSIGLYRSEILFMIRDRFPGEEEQRIIYQQVLSSFPNQAVTLRVLDVGADKTLPYFYEEEHNPALGWRGIRMMLDQSDLFLTQVRAMLKASVNVDNLNILLPMVSTIDEIKEAKTLIHQAYQEIIEEGLNIAMPKVGVMIEVPSLLILIDKVFEQVDFISIGSNDLTQYMLAVDRTNEKVSSLYSQLSPAMLKVFYYLAKQAHKHQKQISLCGEIAGNPLATPLLIAMGFDSLSMNSSSLLKVKYVLRHLSKKRCNAVLKKVMMMSTTEDVKAYLENFLMKNNLGQLIRAGILTN
ncbi:phosphoenolpyruvate--protein phosphotransferase [Fangia hongkongensis]|uniref:phosphoenolpyruvate--protein phosphotransferase n=1 Tax=Fangia hongkongensis TaxID=270495 RepID=UPI00036E3DB4|nr:phosphoenolpyruvate--protein phosphotransferase [Fangia hongkongensis]MBK2124054.1 phosphoenolpyruvate--protein phosphotransferase [Fangia hongkongensis]